jgi:ATP-dependent Clp protease ATP-binding subunit ClpC
VLLFLDGRLHPLPGPGQTRELRHANNALLSAVARGEVQCIAAATPEQYRDDLRANLIIARCFEPVEVRPPSRQEAVEILRALRERHEAHHRVVIQDDALAAAVELSLNAESGTCLPARAVALLDQAAAAVRLRAAPRSPDLREFENELERLSREKEAAVADGDFEKAATLRDQADRLKKKREQIHREWQERAQQATGAVDRPAVAEAARRLTRPPAP